MKWFQKKKRQTKAITQEQERETISRSDFLKITTAGALVLGLCGKDLAKGFALAQVKGANQIQVSDNLTSTVVASSIAPASSRSLWIDTSSGDVLKFYKNGTWAPVRSTWG